ncbi:histone acetyltransferase KAT6B [Biomphalaria glabrata]|nr:histone acetyltransferase KAT6B [Biomphalaria glabrata]
MFEENEKEWILETINHLKHRKARPDLSRISLRMKKRYFMSFAQTKSLLESLIESGIVVKAVYKNNTSYRDVSKWKKGRLGGQIMNSNRMLKRFIRAIEAIEKTKDTGVTAQDIEDYFKESHGEEKCFLSGAALRDALENEITNGYLKKHCNGLLVHYSVNKDTSDNVLSEDDINDVKTELDLDQTTMSSDHSFDCNSSSDILYLLSNVIKAINETQKSEDVGSTLGDIKDFLIIKGFNFSDDAFLYEFLENEVTRGNLSKSVQDTKYFYSVNMNCVQILDLDLDDSSKTEDIVNEPTETFEIKKPKGKANSSRSKSNIGVIHSETNINTGIRSTHVEKVKKVKMEKENLVGDMQTQNAPLRPPSKRKRIIKDHGPDFEIELPTKVKNKITTDIKESIYPTPTNSPASEKSETNVYHSFQFDKKRRGRPKKYPSPSTSCNTSVVDQLEEDSQHASLCDGSSVDNGERACSTSPHPDISHWTAEQVASYFLSKGYEEEAQSMLEHDLDGTALGLLRRSDIVGPPLGGILKIKKLGVALKLFRDIRNLLYQGNVDNYLDPYEEKPFLRS